jgi:hypothetical protein
VVLRVERLKNLWLLRGLLYHNLLKEYPILIHCTRNTGYCYVLQQHWQCDTPVLSTSGTQQNASSEQYGHEFNSWPVAINFRKRDSSNHHTNLHTTKEASFVPYSWKHLIHTTKVKTSPTDHGTSVLRSPRSSVPLWLPLSALRLSLWCNDIDDSINLLQSNDERLNSLKFTCKQQSTNAKGQHRQSV